jgi:hypothetical protein
VGCRDQKEVSHAPALVMNRRNFQRSQKTSEVWRCGSTVAE